MNLPKTIATGRCSIDTPKTTQKRVGRFSPERYEEGSRDLWPSMCVGFVFGVAIVVRSAYLVRSVFTESLFAAIVFLPVTGQNTASADTQGPRRACDEGPLWQPLLPPPRACERGAA